MARTMRVSHKRRKSHRASGGRRKRRRGGSFFSTLYDNAQTAAFVIPTLFGRPDLGAGLSLAVGLATGATDADRQRNRRLDRDRREVGYQSALAQRIALREQERAYRQRNQGGMRELRSAQQADIKAFYQPQLIA